MNKSKYPRIDDYQIEHYLKLFRKEYTQDELFLISMWELVRSLRQEFIEHRKYMQVYMDALVSPLRKKTAPKTLPYIHESIIHFFLIIKESEEFYSNIDYLRLSENKKIAFIEIFGGTEGINGVKPATPIEDLFQNPKHTVQTIYKKKNKWEKVFSYATIDIQHALQAPKKSQLFAFRADLRFSKADLTKAFLKMIKDRVCYLREKESTLSHISVFDYRMFLLGMFALHLQYPKFPAETKTYREVDINMYLTQRAGLTEAGRESLRLKMRAWDKYTKSVLNGFKNELGRLKVAASQLS